MARGDKCGVVKLPSSLNVVLVLTFELKKIYLITCLEKRKKKMIICSQHLCLRHSALLSNPFSPPPDFSPAAIIYKQYPSVFILHFRLQVVSQSKLFDLHVV